MVHRMGMTSRQRTGELQGVIQYNDIIRGAPELVHRDDNFKFFPTAFEKNAGELRTALSYHFYSPKSRTAMRPFREISTAFAENARDLRTALSYHFYCPKSRTTKRRFRKNPTKTAKRGQKKHPADIAGVSFTHRSSISTLPVRNAGRLLHLHRACPSGALYGFYF